jgi:hypothetical protein
VTMYMSIIMIVRLHVKNVCIVAFALDIHPHRLPRHSITSIIHLSQSRTNTQTYASKPTHTFTAPGRPDPITSQAFGRKQLQPSPASGHDHSVKGRSFSYDNANWMAGRKNSPMLSSKRGPIVDKDEPSRVIIYSVLKHYFVCICKPS